MAKLMDRIIGIYLVVLFLSFVFAVVYHTLSLIF